jgi:hypothetical protein
MEDSVAVFALKVVGCALLGVAPFPTVYFWIEWRELSREGQLPRAWIVRRRR